MIGEEVGVIYQYETSSGIQWKTFGNEKVQPTYKGEIKNGKMDGLGVYVCLCNLPIRIWYYLPGKDQSTPIINHHYSTVQVIEPPKRILIEEEICTRLDGCPIVNNVCVDCLTVKN